MGVRDTLRKAAGFIVELPTEDNEDNQEQEAEVPARPNESASPPIRFQQQPANDSVQAQTVAPLIHVTEEIPTDEITALGPALLSASTGENTFGIIYKRSDVPPATFTAEQMSEILASQPAELPLEAKRQIVKATLHAISKSIGATPETIYADASNKMAALDGYVKRISNQVADFSTRTEAEIESLQAEIAKKRSEIASHQEQEKKLAQLCHAESARLDEVRKFFSQESSFANPLGQNANKQ